MDGIATQCGMVQQGAGGAYYETNAYYFFDPTTLGAGAVANFDGSIATSTNDLGLVATQLTAGHQPTADGINKITFADSNDHLDIPSTAQAGWQIAGTSLGTFWYRVNSGAETELNLLGYNTHTRQTGDLYGLILLPDSATADNIEEARQALVARGAADGVATTSLNNVFRERADIVEFGAIDTSSVTRFAHGWSYCSNLTSFPLINTSSGTVFISTWLFCSSLTSFPLINISSGTRFEYAWGFCSSLTSFPANFFDSWNPALINSSVFSSTWSGCTSLTPQSVENILVSIDTSGKWGTNDGTSGGTVLADNTIDIDYDGTGLTAATTTAITNLKAKSWQIEINGVLQ